RAQPAPDGGGQDEHLVQRDRHRARVAEDGHGGGVANEDEIDAGLLGHLSARVVVGGDHRYRLAERLLLRELRQGHGTALGGRCVAHATSLSTFASTSTIRLRPSTCTTFGS